jgi:hypothetical protein
MQTSDWRKRPLKQPQLIYSGELIRKIRKNIRSFV